MFIYALRLRRALALKSPKHRVFCSGWWCAVQPAPSAFIDSLRSLDTRLHVNESIAAAEAESKFAGDPKDIITGQPKEAATGIYGFIGHTEATIRAGMANGTAAIVEEWEALFIKTHIESWSEKDAEPVIRGFESLCYILDAKAGVDNCPFQKDKFKYDRAPDGSELGPGTESDGSWSIKGRHGKLLKDFVALPMARKGRLEEPHVVGLRLYTTQGYRACNAPMRKLHCDKDGNPVQPPKLAEPHPLPVTMAFIYEGLKRLRAVAAAEETLGDSRSTLGESHSTGPGSPELDALAGVVGIQLENIEVRNSNASSSADVAQSMTGSQDDTVSSTRTESCEGVRKVSIVQLSRNAFQARRRANLGSSDRRSAMRPASETILWRGMKDLRVSQKFLYMGGTELAPMSTTTNLEIAAKYARGTETALIFRLRSTSFMNLGCDLTELSAFPHEKEYLYPSLTFLQPTGLTHTLVHDGTTFTIVEVEPSFPS